jgi:hypothetical protein
MPDIDLGSFLPMLSLAKILAHSNICLVRILKGVRNDLVPKKLVHLLQSPTFGLWEEDDVANGGNQVPGKEEVEEAKSKVLQGDGGALCEDQVERPVRKGGEGVATGANLGREDLNALTD